MSPTSANGCSPSKSEQVMDGLINRSGALYQRLRTVHQRLETHADRHFGSAPKSNANANGEQVMPPGTVNVLGELLSGCFRTLDLIDDELERISQL